MGPNPSALGRNSFGAILHLARVCVQTHTAGNARHRVITTDVVLFRFAVQSPHPRRLGRRCGGGFTLIELLIVIAIIAILAALLLPVLGTAKAKSRTVACVNQLKQFAAAAQMYAGDNAGFLAPNFPAGSNSWVLGSMKLDSQATNTAWLRQGKLFPYVSQPRLYHCPADAAIAPNYGPHVRSYAMNSWIGSRTMEAGGPAARGFHTFVKDAEFAAAGAALLWLMADEHEATIDDGYFLVTMDDYRPFASHPALRHQRGFALNFVDGHAESWKLRDPNSGRTGQSQVSSRNTDWLRLKQVTTTTQ